MFTNEHFIVDKQALSKSQIALKLIVAKKQKKLTHKKVAFIEAYIIHSEHFSEVKMLPYEHFLD